MAAVYTNGYMPGQARFSKLNEREEGITTNLPNILESYHYIKKQKIVDEMRSDNAKVFLDSGAFSAFNIGAEISIDDYCNYIKENYDILRIEDGDLMASVLDGIGDPLKTWHNQAYMEKQGVKPLPCFHYGEDPKYLDWYIKHYSYITIGGMVGKSKEQLTIWLDRMWNNHILDGSGKPRLKVHAFGITSVDIMKRYQWYSCDSSSWIQAAAFGSIVSPEFGPLRVSDKSPARHTIGQHISNISEPEQEFIHAMLDKQGFNYDRLSTIYESRAVYNLWSYGEVNTMINKTLQNEITVQELF